METLKSVWKTINTEGGIEYSVKLVLQSNYLISEKSSCTCEWGSFHRYSKGNITKKWLCRHLLKAYVDHLKKPIYEVREVLVEEGILAEDHLKRI
jgi:hypothetical protein